MFSTAVDLAAVLGIGVLLEESVRRKRRNPNDPQKGSNKNSGRPLEKKHEARPLRSRPPSRLGPEPSVPSSPWPWRLKAPPRPWAPSLRPPAELETLKSKAHCVPKRPTFSITPMDRRFLMAFNGKLLDGRQGFYDLPNQLSCKSLPGFLFIAFPAACLFLFSRVCQPNISGLKGTPRN